VTPRTGVTNLRSVSSNAVVNEPGPLQSCLACTLPSEEVVLRTGTRYRAQPSGFGDLILPCSYPLNSVL
jgi:hypothetical protein